MRPVSSRACVLCGVHLDSTIFTKSLKRTFSVDNGQRIVNERSFGARWISCLVNVKHSTIAFQEVTSLNSTDRSRRVGASSMSSTNSDCANILMCKEDSLQAERETKDMMFLPGFDTALRLRRAGSTRCSIKYSVASSQSVLKWEVNRCSVDMVEFVTISPTQANFLQRVTIKNDKFDADSTK